MSLRGIAKQTSLSLRTVRTVVETGTDKGRTRIGELRREMFDRMAAANAKV